MTILAIVCDPPKTLLFADRRTQFYDPAGALVGWRDDLVKVRAHARAGVIWSVAGTANLSLDGRDGHALDVVGTFFDRTEGEFDPDDLMRFLAPLVIDRGRYLPGSLHLLLGTVSEALYFFFPSNPGTGAPDMERAQWRIIPSLDSADFFGGWFPGPQYAPHRGSADSIVDFMRPLLERAITFAQQNKGADCDVAGPIDVALVSPAGARILEG